MRVLSFLGWTGSILGIASLLLCFLTLIEGNPKHSGAPYGFAMFAILLGLPGMTTLWRLHRRKQARAFHAQLLGYAKSYDAFTAEELARKIGRTEMETEGLVAALIQSDGLELVFHRKSRQYMHRKRLKTNHRILNRCTACGASIGSQIIFEDEIVTCQYCEHPLTAPELASK